VSACDGQSVPVDEAAKWRLQEGDELLFLLPITGG
jgi:sulfur carrier protein ThiS